MSTQTQPLDRGERALLDLARQGLPYDKLAQVLDTDPAEVERRCAALAERDEAVALVAADRDQAAVPAPRRGGRADVLLRGVAALYLIALLLAVVAYKGVFFETIRVDPWFGAYGLVVVTFIVSRFVLSLFYRTPRDAGLEPTVAIIMPAFNEEAAIGASLRSLLAVEYPQHKLEIVAVDDGSTDGTLAELRRVAAETDRVRLIEFPENRGKRAAMAAGIRETDAEIVAFVDSDSVLEPGALRRLVQGFANRKVGAVCGHADVLNVDESWLTRMQAVRYFVAFRVIKAAESLFGCVTCCSGCFSAYRRSAILPDLDWWEEQSFLGRPSPFGDDRSLTNAVLRRWRVLYVADATAQTVVPATFRQFMRQQLRWKKSWTRESLIVGTFIWRRHPIAALTTYVGIVLPLLAPVVAIRAIGWHSVAAGEVPWVYLTGLYSMALAYGLYYVVCRRRYEAVWIYGIAFCFFYLAFLVWQTYWAILTVRKGSWGTRPSTAASGDGPAALQPAHR